MDIKHTPFPSGLVMTPSGGLEYLKMPVGLVQGPNGELIPTASAHPTLVHTVGPAASGGHITVMPAGAINIPAHVGKMASSSSNSGNLPPTVTMVPAIPFSNVSTNQQLQQLHQPQAQQHQHQQTQHTQVQPQQQQQQLQLTTTSSGPIMKDCSTSTVSLPTSMTPLTHETAILITQPKYVCEICNKGFKSGYNLKRHQNDYHGENSEIIKAKTSHICALCAKPFLSSHNLKRHHMDFHSDSRLTYHCELCRKNFQNRFNLKRHRIGIHSGPGGQFQCEICNKYFHYQSNLSRHRKDVHRSGPGFPGTQVVLHASHKTAVKKQILALPAPLLNGQTIISGAQPVVSGAQQIQTSQLQTIHTSNHQTIQTIQIQPNTSGKAFVCDLCNKDFQNTYNLKRHRINVHKETKILYRCDQCGKDFPSIGNFKRHKNLVHGLGKQAFHCTTCDKNFASKDGLKRHISAIHDTSEGAFKCETCEKRFKRKDYLDKHIISAHENKYTIITADAAVPTNGIVESSIITSTSNIC